MDVGARLKFFRKKIGVSQRELAKRVGVTNSTISMIEKNNVSPSVTSLQKILSGLSISLVEFFNSCEADVYLPQLVYRNEDLKDISSSQVRRLLYGQYSPNRQMDFVVESFPAGAEESYKEGEITKDKAGLLLEGQLVLMIADQVHVLNAGDGFYFNSTEAHFIRNESDSSARLLIAQLL